MFKRFYILMAEAGEPAAVSGYEGDATPAPATPADTTFELPKDEPIEGDSGYSTDDPAPAETPKPAETSKPAEGDKPAETPVEDYTVEVEGVNPDDVKDIVDLAKNNKLNKEQATELVKYYKSRMDAQASQMQAEEQRIKELYNQWADELRNDPEFGGANFKTNVNNVNTVLGKHFPTMATTLKEKGLRMAPSLMKEMSKIHSLLYGEKPMVGGETGAPTKQTNPWDFYKG